MEWRNVDHLIVVAAISQWRCRLSVSLLVSERCSRWTFCGVFIVQCVQLTPRIFEFGARAGLFDCFVYRQNVTCLKHFIRYGNYTGKVEHIIIGRLAVVS